MKILKSIFILFLLFNTVSLKAQNVIERGDSIIITRAVVLDGDTIPNIRLKEIVIFPDMVFKNKQQARRYTKLMRDLKRVYPYARLAKDKLDEMEREYNKLKTDKERKKYAETVEKQLVDEFGAELKKLTVTQGRLLLKLIDRETGNTSYELLKELRGTFSAVFWQTIARLFGSDLKAEYNAEGDDILIERIVVLIEHGQI
ncbi:MAG: hypothetical protein A2X13_14415 [Bacteroidetes bacterium GWC2_33_15]|nr:MAG: hypothetical protein A2X10_12460 [Bacteroidetes bacterium GWA2_33_15]OFX50067.1 MAG: hypothetical protein A2X13_14415 [Bacteroidetes bacterium GWC2_33_15]OFX65220.1 MAG: hypothetical protein A2X15_03990 [Bacteroidetes bacterium GWB2_32_14]OFX70446.1 MAG: hypothetical protein A2X14_04045 [Bacteroidetes bacterium GWD2_33_33]HAN19683.1 DUF4294 domain-containing protein [Bacteroidales bacterium]